MEGMGLLDNYLVNVERIESWAGCLADEDLAVFDDCEHAIGCWMRLDGSNPCFTDMNDMDIHGHIMQASVCVVYLIFSFRSFLSLETDTGFTLNNSPSQHHCRCSPAQDTIVIVPNVCASRA